MNDWMTDLETFRLILRLDELRIGDVVRWSLVSNPTHVGEYTVVSRAAINSIRNYFLVEGSGHDWKFDGWRRP